MPWEINSFTSPSQTTRLGRLDVSDWEHPLDWVMKTVTTKKIIFIIVRHSINQLEKHLIQVNEIIIISKKKKKNHIYYQGKKNITLLWWQISKAIRISSKIF